MRLGFHTTNPLTFGIKKSCKVFNRVKLLSTLDSVSRKIGKANKRNLLKRRIKAIVYENSAHYEGLIFIFVAKDGATSLAFPMLKRDVLSAFTRAYDMLCFPSQKSSLKKRYECY